MDQFCGASFDGDRKEPTESSAAASSGILPESSLSDGSNTNNETHIHLRYVCTMYLMLVVDVLLSEFVLVEKCTHPYLVVV